MIIDNPLHGKDAPNVGNASKKLVQTKLKTNTVKANSEATLPQTSSKKK